MTTGFLLYGTSNTVVLPNTVSPGPNWTGYKGENTASLPTNTGEGSGGDPTAISQLQLRNLYGSGFNQPAVITCSMPEGMWIDDQPSNVISIKAGMNEFKFKPLNYILVVCEGSDPLTIQGNTLTWNPNTKEWAYNFILDRTATQKANNMYGPVKVTIIGVPYNGYQWAITRTFYLGDKSLRPSRYVNCDTGVDDTQTGRGLTASMPFKTIQFAISQVPASVGIGANIYLAKSSNKYLCDYKDVSTSANVASGTVLVNSSPHLITVQAASGNKTDVTITKTLINAMGYGTEKSNSAGGLGELYSCAHSVLFKNVTVDMGPFWGFTTADNVVAATTKYGKISKKFYFQNFSFIDSVYGTTGMIVDPVTGIADSNGVFGGFGSFGAIGNTFANVNVARNYYINALMEGDASMVQCKGGTTQVRRNFTIDAGFDALYKNPDVFLGLTDITGLPCQDNDNFCLLNSTTTVKNNTPWKVRYHNQCLVRVTGIKTYNTNIVKSSGSTYSITLASDANIGDKTLYLTDTFTTSSLFNASTFSVTNSSNVTTTYAITVTSAGATAKTVGLLTALTQSIPAGTTLSVLGYATGTSSSPLKYGVTVLTFDQSPPGANGSPVWNTRTGISGNGDDNIQFVTGNLGTGNNGGPWTLLTQYINDGFQAAGSTTTTFPGSAACTYGLGIVALPRMAITLDDGTSHVLGDNEVAMIGSTVGSYAPAIGDYALVYNDNHTDISQIITSSVAVPNQRNWWYENYLALGKAVNLFLMQAGASNAKDADVVGTASVSATGYVIADAAFTSPKSLYNGVPNPPAPIRAGDCLTMTVDGVVQYNYVLWANAAGTEGQLDYPFTSADGSTAKAVASGTSVTKSATSYGWMYINCAMYAPKPLTGQVTATGNCGMYNCTFADNGPTIEGPCRALVMYDCVFGQVSFPVGNYVAITPTVGFTDPKTYINLTVGNTMIVQSGIYATPPSKYQILNNQGVSTVKTNVAIVFDSYGAGKTQTLKVKPPTGTNMLTVTCDANNNPMIYAAMDLSVRTPQSPIGAQPTLLT